ncbi:MAG: hypothetical protein JW874_01885 [Spirochaetales bacterium]|nr:hypothetical protein [Spirochaetales bacterium]
MRKILYVIMQVLLDGKPYTAAFTDTMTAQDLKLPGKVSFTEVKLVIKAVYDTAKWQDTALSGVEFWLDGKEIEVDYSDFEWALKKAE